ncbi:hypothetical protein Sjap_008892 [Stephania japonica]|uniref:Uncharacterized protein n=1 Tax=Stephania japonica TaxID=461633 RepID=A0AAP0JQF6_9MAGN
MASNGYEGNGSNFSSPMPAIGLDIAGATLVCLVLIVFDVVNAIRERKPWIPCRLFALNSFTLTLLSVATKLPVDLTTSMPSAYDQLSKLCGTALICVSIGLFRISIVNMNESELSASMASLTVVVVTVVVNIFLQMSTGAVFLFKVEHVINLALMLLLLGIMGCFRFTFPGYFSEPFRKSLKYMPRNIRTLKRCYTFSYVASPQLMFIRFSPSATVGMLCTTSCVVLLEAAFRTYSLGQGMKEASDYRWSIWPVVGIQILTVIVGTLAVVSRCLAVSNQMHSLLFIALKKNTILECHNLFLLAQRNWSLWSRTLKHYSRVVFQFFRALEYIFDSLLFLLRIWADCVNELIRVVGDCFALAMRKATVIGFSKRNNGYDDEDDETMVMLRKELDHGLEGVISSIPDFYSDYLLRKSTMDLKFCLEKHSSYPMHSLLKFLGKSTHDSSLGLLKHISNRSDELLLLVCLVRIADSLVPSLRSSSMICALDQAFEIIVFIHEKTKTVCASNSMKTKVAKDIWFSGAISSHWFQTDIIDHFRKGGRANDFLDCSYGIVDKYLLKIVCHEVYDIINIIGEPRFETISNATNEHIEKLYNDIEQLFVELLHSLIDELPDVIFKSVNESVPFVEFEENVKISMELVARLNLLEAQPWCFTNSKIQSFMTTDVVQKDKKLDSDVSLVIGDDADVNLGLFTSHEDAMPAVV